MRRKCPQLARVGSLAARVLLVSLAISASGALLENVPAGERSAAPEKLGAGLARALEGPRSSAGIAVGVALRSDDLPPPGTARRAAIAARQKRALDALPAEGLRLKRRYTSLSGLAGWAQPAAIEALLAHPETEFVYLDGTVHAALAEGSALIGAPSVHAQGSTGTGIRVAVLDTGIDTDHPDLSDDLAAQYCFCDTHPSPVKGCCPGGGPEEANAEDDDGHGTSTSGIITSSRAAGPGVAPDAEIIAVKVLDSGGSGTFSDIAAGLDWLITNHASLGLDVVNMSLGDGTQQNDASVSPCTGSNTANGIQSLHGLGIPVFVSSGNEGHDNGISFPACAAEAISVGGVYDANVGAVSWCGNSTCTTILCTDNPTFADRFVCHTNSGVLLDILAPDFRTATAALGGGTNFDFGGTSASSPYAAAQAALLLEADPTLTPDQIRTLMKTNGPSVTNPENSLSFIRTDVALALATCGNDVVEAGEDCDDGNTDPGDCCSATCQHESAATVCRASAGVCDIEETCDGAGTCPDDSFADAGTLCRSGSGDLCDPDEQCTGSGPSCPSDVLSSAGTVCNPGSGDLCDPDEVCSGTAGQACPADSFASAGTLCRGSAGVCDVAELCTGVADAPCPGDAFQPATTECREAAGVCDAPDYCDGASAPCTADAKLTSECRAATGICDVAEVCDGEADDCPTDSVLDGVPCPDADLCNGDEMCEAGTCVAGAPLVCDDADACTTDSCDAVSGCVNDPIEACGMIPVPSASPASRVLLSLLVLAAGAAFLARRRRFGA
jgi:cysteine-rich repeat protein